MPTCSAAWFVRSRWASTSLAMAHHMTLRAGSAGAGPSSLSQAARLMTGQSAVNGWAFWLTSAGQPVGELRSNTSIGG